MKPRDIVPTKHERVLPTDRYILSTTDLAGRITSVNDLFVEYSGYTEPELVGQQHNIVRHPDMPRAVFQLLWDAVAEGEQFMGYVKNLCKDGSFYWVFAHVSPITDARGQITGYRSVRRHARPEAIARVRVLYAEMLAAEKAAGPRDAITAGLRVLSAHLAAEGKSYEAMVAAL